MPYITRDDGEHFVIPSYRDVLAARNKTQLKKDILLLSQNYGEYITLQRKATNQYEVAFSPDRGYLLGETVWHRFKRPQDLIYCEAISGTTEALLVIVKNGSVYLDGSFPLDSIPEELIIFLTQKNDFEIYIYGDVPISEKPDEGKFSFETSSVKAFTRLDQPVFPTLPLLKIYQLQLVDQVLKAQGIGVFPLRQLISAAAVMVLLFLLYSYLTSNRPQIIPSMAAVNPYQGYYNDLKSPDPVQAMQDLLTQVRLIFTLPGWIPTNISYQPGTFRATVQSNGGRVEALFNWATINNASVDLLPSGVFVNLSSQIANRPIPKKIYTLKDVMGTFVDRLASVYPGNRIKISEMVNRGSYTTMLFDVALEEVSPLVLELIGVQFKDLPFVLKSVALTNTSGSFTGSITLEALGN